MGLGNFDGDMATTIVKYRDIERSSVQKTAEPIVMPFWLWLGLAQGIMN